MLRVWCPFYSQVFNTTLRTHSKTRSFVIWYEKLVNKNDIKFYQDHHSHNHESPGGGGGLLYMEQTGMLVGNFEFNP